MSVSELISWLQEHDANDIVRVKVMGQFSAAIIDVTPHPNYDHNVLILAIEDIEE